MKRHVFFLLSFTLLCASFAWWVVGYTAINAPSLPAGVPISVSQTNQNTPPTPSSLKYTAVPVITNLKVPWSIVFTNQNRMLIAERSGSVQVAVDGKLDSKPLRVFSDVKSNQEEGLMGMTLDPNYSENKFVYLCMAYEKNGQIQDKVVRVTDQGSKLVDDTIIIDLIPAAQFHAGCRVRFGPDGKLYISTGDATNKQDAQKLSSLAGKILRINPDGSIPSDNPFPDSPVLSIGHRNPQGFDWHPTTQQLISTEHGPSLIDGPAGGDEVNLIQAGKNYGWPVVSHQESAEGMVSPLIEFTPAVAPASGMFYTGTRYPELTNTFLFGGLRGAGIYQVVFDPTDASKVLFYQKLPGIDVGRVRDIEQSPDGYIYFTTSNQDGRGSPNTNDDHVFRLTVQE